MEQDKKFTAKEVAIAVLKKAEELLKANQSQRDYSRASTSHEKGVHLPANMGAPVYHQEGHSEAGLSTKIAHQDKEKGRPHGANLAHAKETHKKVLAELKAQPKPDLGKAENGHEKGVHRASKMGIAGAEVDQGRSVPGRALRTGNFPGADKLSSNLGSENANKRALHSHVKEEHKRVLSELKAQPKPDLGKAEAPKKEYKTGAQWDAEAKVRSSEKAKKEIAAANIPELDSKGFYKKPKMAKSIPDPRAPQKDANQHAEGKAPKGEIKPHETEQAPSDNVEPSDQPSHSLEERNGNPGPGSLPTNYGEDYKGHLKLAHFLGRMDYKRKAKAPAPAAPEMEKAEAIPSKKLSNAKKLPKKDTSKLEADSEAPEAPEAAPAPADLAPAAPAAPAAAAPVAPAAPAPAAAPVAAAPAAPAATGSTGDVTSPTKTNTETGGSSPGGASTGGVGSGIGGAGTGGAATGGASTGGAGTVNLTISGNSGTGSNSEGSKPTPITINISNIGGRTDAGNVASGDGPGAKGDGGSGRGSGGGGGGAAPDEPSNFSTASKDKKDTPASADSDSAVAAMSNKMVKSQRSGMHIVEYHKSEKV